MVSEDENGTNISKSTFFKYFKIIFFSFVVPLWIAIIINEGAVLLKILNWLKLEIDFWTVKKFYSLTLILAIFPLMYIYWFYFESIKRLLIKLHEDYIRHWHKELSVLIAENLIKVNKEGREKSKGDDLDFVLIYLNKKLSQLPNLIQKIIRKLIAQIPILDFVNSFDMTQLNNENKESISQNVEGKLNNLVLNLINSSVPFWTRFIIPINIIILVIYSRL